MSAEKMELMPTTLPSLSTAATLAPPRGYRPLAWAGLVANLLAVPLGVGVILLDPIWHAADIAVGAGAVLPTVVVGVIASIALLMWRHWGQILAIIALSMSLAVALPYGIVRLMLVESGRLPLAVGAPLFWALNTAVLVFWCRPAIRTYLR
jgi:hypothetical protein